MKLLLCFLCLGIAGCGEHRYEIRADGVCDTIVAGSYMVSSVCSPDVYQISFVDRWDVQAVGTFYFKTPPSIRLLKDSL